MITLVGFIKGREKLTLLWSDTTKSIYQMTDDIQLQVGLEKSFVEKLFIEVGLIEDMKEDLGERVVKQYKEDSLALINFYKRVNLIENPAAKESVYGWVKQKGVQITEQGYMLLYRRAINLYGHALDEMNRYKAQKKGWKDKLFYGIPLINFIENPKKHFTDAHSRTKLYIIGETVVETNIDKSNVRCSRGLHAGSKNYGFGGLGDTPLAVLINPSDLLYCHTYEDKIRCSKMTFLAVLDSDAKWADDKEVFDFIVENEVPLGELFPRTKEELPLYDSLNKYIQYV